MAELRGDSAFRADSLYGLKNEVTYAGALSFLRRKYTRDLTGVDIAVVGLPFDLATSNRPGARFGPAGLRAASAHMSWSAPHPWPFDPLDRLAIVDYGDVFFDYGYPERFVAEVENAIGAILDAGPEVICLGGDHFVTLPLLRAHAKRHGPLALVHFDAHSDTWRDEKLNHGTMFFHAVKEGIVDPAHSVQVGLRTTNPETHGFTILDNGWVMRNGTEAVAAEIERVTGGRKAYLTFDIDCLDPSYAPGTGTPVCGGLTSFQAIDIIGRLGEVKWVAMDLVEVAPAYDIAEITALAGATLIQHYLAMRAQNLPDRV